MTRNQVYWAERKGVRELKKLGSKEQYRPRVVDDMVETYLRTFGAVCIEGPKWCGKTWTSSYHSNSEFYIGDPENNFQNRALTELSPAMVLEGDTSVCTAPGQFLKFRLSGTRFGIRLTREGKRGSLF